MSRVAVLAVARAELRNRWRSMVVLGVLAGLVGAVLTGAVALTRRTASAHDRLVAATHLDDAQVLLFSDAVRPDEVTSLPGVSAVYATQQVVGQVMGAPGVAYLSVSSSPQRNRPVFTPVIVRGRDVRPDAVDEVIVPEELLREYGGGLGTRIRLKLLTALEMTQFDTGFGEPDGPYATLRIVGIARGDRAWYGSGVGPVLASPAFHRRYAGSMLGHELQLKLADGPAGVPAFRRALAPLAARPSHDLLGREFGTLSADYPTSARTPAIAAARRTLGAGLLGFIAVALLGGLLAVAQGLNRHHGLGAAEQRIEAALGLTRGERVAARVLPALLGAGIAFVLAAAGGLASAGLEPLGSLAASEPAPGWRPDWPVIIGTAAASAAVFLAVAAWTAARVVPRSDLPPAPSGVARGLRLFGRAAPAAAGLSFALSGGRGRTAVPVRTTMVSAAIGVLGVVALSTFGASLHRLGAEPARYGWTADFAIEDFKPATLRALQRDPRVSDVFVVTDLTTSVNGRPEDVVSFVHGKGHLPLTFVAGREPRAQWEIALGTRTADRLGVGVGDSVTLASATGPHPARVVGLLVNPDVNDVGIGASSIVTTATHGRTGQAAPFRTGLVRAAPGVDAAALAADLGKTLELQRAGQPPEVRNLVALGSLPRLLAAFLALVAASVLAHCLVVTTRRRPRDLAVLRAIGFTPRQVGASLVLAAVAAAVVGLVIGVPLGLGVGRLVWYEIATGIGVAGDVALPVGLLAAVVPVTLAVAAAVALVPGWRAARQPPADALRGE